MPLDGISLNDESVYIPNDSPDWLDEPSPDRHLCIHDEHQDGCEHFRAPSHPDPTVTYDNPSSFMSLHDLEDMNILADIEFSSDDELPDLIQRTFCSNPYVACATYKIAVFCEHSSTYHSKDGHKG